MSDLEKYLEEAKQRAEAVKAGPTMTTIDEQYVTDIPRLIAIIEKIQERGCLIDADYRELDEIARGEK